MLKYASRNVMVLTTANHSTIAERGDADCYDTSRRPFPEPRWRRLKSSLPSIREPNNSELSAAKISIRWG